MKRNRIAILTLCLICIHLLSGCQSPAEYFFNIEQDQGFGEDGAKYYEDSSHGKQTEEIEIPHFGSSQEETGIEIVQGISQGNYGYECLDDEGKQVYDQMLDTILSYREKVELISTDTELMRQAYQAMTSDYGGLFWVEGYTYTSYTRGDELVGLEFAPNYVMDEQHKDELQSQIDDIVEEWLGGISLKDSDYDKAKYVFETLVEQVDYVEGAVQNQNILSVFLHRQTVCQGYACATQYLLRQLGIPSIIVSGYANEEAHAWNVVQLDGLYYHMDTTWGNSTYLDTDSQESKFVNYNFLCMADDEIFTTHQPQMMFPLPECNSMEHNYYVREGVYFDTWDPEAIGTVFQEAWKSGLSSVAVKCKDAELYQQLKDYFVSQQRIADYCDGIASIYYLESPELCVFTVNFY